MKSALWALVLILTVGCLILFYASTQIGYRAKDLEPEWEKIKNSIEKSSPELAKLKRQILEGCQIVEPGLVHSCFEEHFRSTNLNWIQITDIGTNPSQILALPSSNFFIQGDNIFDAKLIISCSKENQYFAFQLNEPVEINGVTTILLFDKEIGEKLEFARLERYDNFGIRSKIFFTSLVEKVRNSNELTVHIFPDNKALRVFHFNVTGFDEHLPKLQQGCGI